MGFKPIMRLNWILALITLLLTLVALRYLIGWIRCSWRFAVVLIGVSVASLAFFWPGKPASKDVKPAKTHWQTQVPEYLR